MSSTDLLPSGKPRRPLRPLYGIPDRDTLGREGLVFSAILDLISLELLVLTPIIASTVEFEPSTGGGVAGPAGGGCG